jgi:hypothetical protein
VSPALNVEFFLTALYESTREQGGHGPHPQDAAYLLTRYRSEFGLSVIPWFVQKFVFPIQIWLGRRSGRLDKFKDAPEPARG